MLITNPGRQLDRQVCSSRERSKLRYKFKSYQKVIIFRVMQLDETSQGEGRMGEKSPGLSSGTGRPGKEGDLPGHWRETWGVQCPKARRR